MDAQRFEKPQVQDRYLKVARGRGQVWLRPHADTMVMRRFKSSRPHFKRGGIMAIREGICSVCGHKVPLDTKGKALEHHRDAGKMENSRTQYRCSGSKKPPK